MLNICYLFGASVGQAVLCILGDVFPHVGPILVSGDEFEDFFAGGMPC